MGNNTQTFLLNVIQWQQEGVRNSPHSLCCCMDKKMIKKGELYWWYLSEKQYRERVQKKDYAVGEGCCRTELLKMWFLFQSVGITWSRVTNANVRTWFTPSGWEYLFWCPGICWKKFFVYSSAYEGFGSSAQGDPKIFEVGKSTLDVGLPLHIKKQSLTLIEDINLTLLYLVKKIRGIIWVFPLPISVRNSEPCTGPLNTFCPY